MKSRTKSELKCTHPREATVYGLLDRQCVEEIDRVADQMLMPRSWVVTQILQEWVEHRRMDITQHEHSWNDSFRELLGQRDPEDADLKQAMSA